METTLITIPLWLALSLFANQLIAAPAPVTADEAREIAVDAYIYAYPLVLISRHHSPTPQPREVS